MILKKKSKKQTYDSNETWFLYYKVGHVRVSNYIKQLDCFIPAAKHENVCCRILSPYPNICRFEFFTPNLIIHLIKKIKL
jgi:hypothetical protein